VNPHIRYDLTNKGIHTTNGNIQKGVLPLLGLKPGEEQNVYLINTNGLSDIIENIFQPPVSKKKILRNMAAEL
jgi:hypothetical protein